MSLKLYYHPLSSFCQKVLGALYEGDIPFEPSIVNLMDPAERAQFVKLWPIGKFPVLCDEAKGRTIPESSVIIEYLALHYPGAAHLMPKDAQLAWHTRAQDRFYDLYLEEPMQKIVGDRWRPAENRDPFGVEQARARMRTAYDVADRDMQGKTWAVGDNFTMADCGAAPALFYANIVEPFVDARPNLAAYYKRLIERPSFARVADEAKPYLHLMPK